jgi:hypothetical protein
LRSAPSSTEGLTGQYAKSANEAKISYDGLRSKGSHLIQDIKELQKVPVIVLADVSRSPPVLVVYAGMCRIVCGESADIQPTRMPSRSTRVIGLMLGTLRKLDGNGGKREEAKYLNLDHRSPHHCIQNTSYHVFVCLGRCESSSSVLPNGAV